MVGMLAKDDAQMLEGSREQTVIGVMDQLVDVVERHRVDTIAVCLEDRRAILPSKSCSI